MNKTTKFLALSAGLGLAFVFGYAAPAGENWENHCAKCHGADGKGQTKVGKKLNLKDYTDAKVQVAETKAARAEKKAEKKEAKREAKEAEAASGEAASQDEGAV